MSIQNSTVQLTGWLAEKIKNVIVTGDFHLATQMVGADTSDFFLLWKMSKKDLEFRTRGQRQHETSPMNFKISIGYINGKRCLGGFLELLMHCHYLVFS